MKSSYSIGEAARLTAVPAKTIRYYSDIGVLTPSEITEAGYRRYSNQDIIKIGLIRNLRSLDFSLEDIKRMMEGSEDIGSLIRLQIERLETARRSINRQLAVLTLVNEEHSEGDLLRHIQLANAATSLTNAERQGQLARYVDAVDSRHSHDPFNVALRTFVLEGLPEEVSPRQLAAWLHIYEGLQDPSTVEGLRRLAEPFQAHPVPEAFDNSEFIETLNQTRELAIDYAEQGRSADDPEVRALAERWARTYAQAMGRPYDDAFIEWFIEYAARDLMDPDCSEFWRNVRTLRNAPDRHALPGFELRIKALQNCSPKRVTSSSA